MQRIYNTIETYQMIEPGMKVIAGVSGGADSVCLLIALAKYREKVPFSLSVVHVEHGIRGEESLEDAAFVQELCGQLQVDFYLEPCRVTQYAAEHGMTVEEAGRVLRYQSFEKVRKQIGADRIAVAHNENDQAETVLWNLIRGSGVKGLGGIRPVRGRVIRPLLFLERSEIEALLREQGQSWRTDRTNASCDYTRNRLRNEILPQMEQHLNRQAMRHIAQSAENLQSVQAYLESQTERAAAGCVKQEGDQSVRLFLQPYCSQEPLIQQELMRLCLGKLQGYGAKDIGRVHMEQLLALAEKDCGKEVQLPHQLRAVREKDCIRFLLSEHRKGQKDGKEENSAKRTEVRISLENGSQQLELDGKRVTLELMENSDRVQQEIQTEKKYTKWLSYDTINRNVCFRTRSSGDYLVINEAGGRRKLKDYLIDQKVPRDCRDQIWLLADGSHILWAVGMRISERAKVRQDTKLVLKIQIEEDDHEGESKDFSAGAGSK